MFLTGVLALGLVSALSPGPGDEADVRALYEKQRAEAGRAADSQARLALWCEHHGLTSERAEHLAKALLADPANAIARALLGQVRDGDRWVKADDLADKIASDAARAAALAEYNRRRSETELNPAAHSALAAWCEENGLSAEAQAHWTTVVRLDPTRESAWKKLGCRKYQGQWLTEEQISAAEAERRAQERANRLWAGRLSRLVEQLGRERTRDGAQKTLDEITDPRAVPAVWKLFVGRGEAGQLAAVRVFGQVDAVAASHALAALSVHGDSAEVRRQAAENLRRRDRREYLDLLIAQVRKPLKYELRPNPVTNAVELYVEGVAYDLQRTYQYPTVAGDPRTFFDPYFAAGTALQGRISQAIWARAMQDASSNQALRAAVEQIGDNPAQAGGLLAARPLDNLGGFAPAGLPGQGPATLGGDPATNPALTSDEQMLRQREARAARNIENFQAAVANTEARVQRDCAEIENLNAAYGEQNKRVLPVLQDLTGNDHGAEPEAWTRWWTDEQGYAYRSGTKPVFREVIAADQPLISANASSSCFAAGTSVHTRDGLKPIESVQIGDQILSQDVSTGVLRFEPVVGAWHNPPDQTYRVRIGADTIVATGIHRFWKAQQGWTMVRDLRAGDLVRTRGGVARVEGVETDAVAPVFNLEVPEGRSFFVGRLGALVHDYSLIETVDQPFDRIEVK